MPKSNSVQFLWIVTFFIIMMLHLSDMEVLQSVEAPTPESLVKGLKRLLSLPDVCVRLNQLLYDDSSSAEMIADVIAQDTDLSARLLRTVNSVYFNMVSPVETITRAVTIAGTEEVRDLTTVAAMCQLFPGIPEEMLIMDDFWYYSVATSVNARAIGKLCRVLHPERLYVMGMLHDIGRLVILKYLPVQARDIMLIMGDSTRNLPEAEREVLGYDHAEVGYQLLLNWGLPEGIATVIRNHHEPERSGTYQLETAVIHIASLLGEAHAAQRSLQEAMVGCSPAALELTGLTSSQCVEIGSQVTSDVTDCFALLFG